MSENSLADLCFRGATVADVIAGEWLTDVDVLVKDGLILAIAKTGSIPAKETIDLKGSFLLPAFIDAHVHIESSMLTPETFGELIAENGTCCAIVDPHEIANVLGTVGLDYMIKAAQLSPAEIRFMLPSCVPATGFETSGATLTAEELEPFYDNPMVLGLAEVMNVPGVLMNDPEVMKKIESAKRRNRPIDGHAPLLLGKGLCEYAAAGISTDHECSTTQEVLERIACGMTVALRQGSVAKNLATLLGAVTKDNYTHCMFCCDDVNPSELRTRGHMQRHLRRTVEHGFSPMMAVQLASINTARHYGLNDIGAIASGRKAHMVLVDNLVNFNTKAVWLYGKKVAENNTYLLPHKKLPLPSAVATSVQFAPLRKEDLKLTIQSDKAHVIGLIPRQILTKNLVLPVKTRDGVFYAEDNPGLVKLVVIERHNATGHIGLGIVSHYLKPKATMNGAVGTTIAHDSHNIVVAGGNDEDMLLVVKRLKEIGGGMVLVKEGRVAAELPLAVAGLMSEESTDSFIEKQSAFYKTAQTLFDVDPNLDVVMTLSFLALPVIPSLRVTDLGLFDVDKFSLTPIEA